MSNAFKNPGSDAGVDIKASEKIIIPSYLSFGPATVLLRVLNKHDIPNSKRLVPGPKSDVISG